MREYTVMINGLPHTLKLDDADAERMGAVPVAPPATKMRAPKNKARTPRNKSGL